MMNCLKGTVFNLVFDMEALIGRWCVLPSLYADNWNYMYF